MRRQQQILSPSLPPLPFGHPDSVGAGLQSRAEDLLLGKEGYTTATGSVMLLMRACSHPLQNLHSTPHQVVPFLTAGVVPFPLAANSSWSSK
jgi:hypothetical protein